MISPAMLSTIAQGRRRNLPPAAAILNMANLGFNAANAPSHASYEPVRWWVDCFKDARNDASMVYDANGWPAQAGAITLCTQALTSGGIPTTPTDGAAFAVGDTLTGQVDKNCTVTSGNGCSVTVGSTVGLFTNFTVSVTSITGSNSINISGACPNGIFIARNGYSIADITTYVWHQKSLAYQAQFGGQRCMKAQLTESKTNQCNIWNPITNGWQTFNTTSIVGDGTTCTVGAPAAFVSMIGSAGATFSVNISQGGSVTAGFVGTFTMTVVDSTHLSFASATSGTSAGQGGITVNASIAVSGNVATITLPSAMMTQLGTTYDTTISIASGVTPVDFNGGFRLTKTSSTTATWPTVALSSSTNALVRPGISPPAVGTFPPQLWTDRATPSNTKTGFGFKGSTYEDLVAWANALYAYPNSKFRTLRVNFHMGQNSVLTNATDVWDGAFAYMRDNLNTNIRVEGEQHNEIWNPSYGEPYSYYFYAVRQLAAVLSNGTGFVDIASVTCDGTTATITTTIPLTSHPGYANIGTAPSWTEGRTGLTTGLLSVSGVATALNLKNVAFTVTGANTITYPCTATAGTNVVPAYGSNAFICLTAGQGICYDNNASFSTLKARVVALDVRRMGLSAEAAYGAGSIGTRVFPTFAYQAVVNTPPVNDAMKYLSTVFPSRLPKTYIRSGSIAPYNQPNTGTDATTMLAAFTANNATGGNDQTVLWEWAKQCTYWGLDLDGYEWNISFLSSPAAEATVDALKDDATALRQPLVDRAQLMIDAGMKRCYMLGPGTYYQWQKGGLSPGLSPMAIKAENVNAQLPSVATYAWMQGIGDIDALIPSAKTGWVQGPGTTVFNSSTTNVFPFYGVIAATDGVLGWGISSGQYGVTATSGQAGTVASLAFVIAIATATTSLNFTAFMNAGANKAWSVAIDDGTPQTFTMTNTASGTFATGTYGATPSMSIGLSPGLHKIVLTMHTVANGDSIGVQSITTS